MERTITELRQDCIISCRHIKHRNNAAGKELDKKITSLRTRKSDTGCRLPSGSCTRRLLKSPICVTMMPCRDHPNGCAQDHHLSGIAFASARHVKARTRHFSSRRGFSFEATRTQRSEHSAARVDSATTHIDVEQPLPGRSGTQHRVKCRNPGTCKAEQQQSQVEERRHRTARSPPARDVACRQGGVAIINPRFDLDSTPRTQFLHVTTPGLAMKKGTTK